MNKKNEVSVIVLEQIASKDIVSLIFDVAPRKVSSRVAKSADHINKAQRLIDVDDEMGFIRLIAAEEELVVAIFEQLKLNATRMPEHSDFIKKYKNHYVKLAFPPVLICLASIFENIFSTGVHLEGFEGLRWTANIVRKNNRVILRISPENSKKSFDLNPLDVQLNRGEDDERVSDAELFLEFSRFIRERAGKSVKEFVTDRADFRNKILYAEDAGFATLYDKLGEVYEKSFVPSYRLLLQVLAVLLTNVPLSKSWGVVEQFISVYRRVLSECKIIQTQDSAQS
ncbi:hypothetical protein [Herbaspirillum sp. 1130]|uniref:hypothetical protein n=1 Tax=Herbaspirillum sp. 1130 TaxID=2806562 RepID=UPI001AE64064|nr:hypothetical protein [Herbaspirillum sp. 1130]MBP1314389.1 hypothetical protein [Herbaspirillum sp. 1130]